MKLKVCYVCNEDKPLSDYSFSKNRDRHKATCKKCVAKRAREKRAEKAEANLRFCKQCKVWLDVSLFQCDRANRYHYECKKCTLFLTREGTFSKSVIIGSEKLCLECHKLKDISLFKPGRGIGDIQAYCMPCLKIRGQRKYKKEKAKYRERSYKWRIDNREVYLAQHRIHQFNRENQIKAQSDGTVTEDFLKEIYATNNCFYCERETPRDDRTLEHLVPLSRGGLHSIYNIEMACVNCNSSRQHKTVEEWNEYKEL